MVKVMRSRRKAASPTAEKRDDQLAMEQRQIAGRRFRLRLVHVAAGGQILALALVAGIAAETKRSRFVFGAGLLIALVAALVAGAGSYLMTRAAIAAQQRTIAQIRAELDHDPAEAERVLAGLWRREGLSPEGAHTVTRIIAMDPEAWLRTLLEKRFGLSVEAPAHEAREALLIGVAALGGALLPALPFALLAPRPALFLLALLGAVVLAILGSIAGRLTRRNPAMAAFEWLAAGALIGALGYLVGVMVPR